MWLCTTLIGICAQIVVDDVFTHGFDVSLSLCLRCDQFDLATSCINYFSDCLLVRTWGLFAFIHLEYDLTNIPAVLIYYLISEHLEVLLAESSLLKVIEYWSYMVSKWIEIIHIIIKLQGSMSTYCTHLRVSTLDMTLRTSFEIWNIVFLPKFSLLEILMDPTCIGGG